MVIGWRRLHCFHSLNGLVHWHQYTSEFVSVESVLLYLTVFEFVSWRLGDSPIAVAAAQAVREAPQ